MAAAVQSILPTLFTAGIGAAAAYGVNKLTSKKKTSAPAAPAAPIQNAPSAPIAPGAEPVEDRRRGAGVASGASALRLPPLARGGALGGGRTTLLGGG